MTLDEILLNVADQDRGRELEILDPWTGQPAGIRFRIAGPDSEIQRKARLAMMDRLSELSEPDGTITAANREKARIECLAACVIVMEITEGEETVAATAKYIFRVLSAATWLQAQVDAFAGDRRNFRPEVP